MKPKIDFDRIDDVDEAIYQVNMYNLQTFVIVSFLSLSIGYIIHHFYEIPMIHFIQNIIEDKKIKSE